MANVYFGDTFGVADNNWNTSIQFTVSGVAEAPTAGAIYSNNGIQFTVTSASIAAGSGTINAGGSGTSAASGTLTKVSGTGSQTITFSAKADVNWFSDPGFVCGACGETCFPGFDIPGTPLGRLPTTADTVIVGNTINVPSYITPWPSGVTVNTLYRVYGEVFVGTINAGRFTGTIASNFGVLGGSIICDGAVTTGGQFTTINGGTFNGTVTGFFLFLNGSPIFNSTVSIGTSGQDARIFINGNPTFNGTIINPRGTTGRHSGQFRVQSGTPVFNCAIPNNMVTYELLGGVYDRPLVLGLVSPTVSPGCFITIGAGFSTSQNVTLNSKRTTGSGSITITGGVFTGLLTINKASAISYNITGGTYSPPAVTTPAIKSGNNMTFSYADIPASYGFGTSGSTFNPTVLLSGTTNDIMGSGLQ
jgi:hypothetical protein